MPDPFFDIFLRARIFNPQVNYGKRWGTQSVGVSFNSMDAAHTVVPHEIGKYIPRLFLFSSWKLCKSLHG